MVGATKRTAEHIVDIIKILVVVVTMSITVSMTVSKTSYSSGEKIGKTETEVKKICEALTNLGEKQEQHDDVIAEIRRQQEYQRGVFTTKLEFLEKSTTNIEKDMKKLLNNLQLSEE